MLQHMISEIRNKLMETPDTVCLERACFVTESYRLYEQDSPVMKRAKTFSHILSHMTMDLTTNPVFAGNTSTAPRAWMLVPEYGFAEPAQIVIEQDHLKGLLDNAIPANLLDFWKNRSFGGNSGIGHLAVDYNSVVHKGLESILAKCNERNPLLSPSQQDYREAMAMSLHAVINWAHRYADAADKAAKLCHDPLIRKCHERVATACRHVPAKPARSLFEALQAIVLIHLAIYIEGQGLSVSIGLLDRILAPYIDSDFDSAYATDLLSAFLLKINANSLFGSGSKTQSITVGGLDAAGLDQCNAITLCVLDAADRVRIGDPHLFLRWHSRIDKAIKTRAIEMLAAGVSMPLLVNDVPTVHGFLDAGIDIEDAWNYCIIGCNELGIPGMLMESATALNGSVIYLELLNNLLLNHPNLDNISCTDDLLVEIESAMMESTLRMRKHAQKRKQVIAQNMPSPFTSALMPNCVQQGMDIMVGMKYQLPGIYEHSFTNAVNALAAIEDIVFASKYISLQNLVKAMRCNYAGEEKLVARIRQAPKWGADDPRADKWAYALINIRERVLDAVDHQANNGRHMSCHVVRSLHHITGKRIQASPDGRLDGEPIADSIGAETGTAMDGPTGVLNSVVKLHAAKHYRGGTNLNLTLPSIHWNTPEMRENMVAMIETFFDQGGQELQIGCLNAEVLRDAMIHPEHHGDLLVRVAGFNARFVDLSKLEQEEMLRRAEDISGL